MSKGFGKYVGVAVTRKSDGALGEVIDAQEIVTRGVLFPVSTVYVVRYENDELLDGSFSTSQLKSFFRPTKGKW